MENEKLTILVRFLLENFWAILIGIFIFLFIIATIIEHKVTKKTEPILLDLKKREQELSEREENIDKVISDERRLRKEAEKERDEWKRELDFHKKNLQILLSSNLKSIPWLAGMMADYLTYDLEVEAKKLEWGSNVQRQKKVASLRDIRADTKTRIQAAKEAVYQLEYLKALYPSLDDILESDYKDLNFTGQIPEYDPIRSYLTKEEWDELSPAEKDQLALDRYVQSRSKSKWQIGRDYELSVAHEFIRSGYSVDTFGSYMKLDDLGRDLIAKNGRRTYIIQCKYWSASKTIHEKHIFQLYGTLVTYKIENPNFLTTVQGLFVTNTMLSPKAREVADMLGISIRENHQMTDFPRIKCNIGHDELDQPISTIFLWMPSMTQSRLKTPESSMLILCKKQ